MIGANTVVWNLAADNNFHVALTPMVGGDELTAHFGESATAYNRCAVLRTTNGHVIVYWGADSNVSVAATYSSSTSQTTYDVAGSNTHFSWKTGKAKPSIRVHDPYTFSFALNGIDIVPTTRLSDALGAIIEGGFGAFGNVSLTVGASYWSKVSHSLAYGLGPRNIHEFGDSKTERWHGDRTFYMREALDGFTGLRIQGYVNHAVGGQTAAQQSLLLQATPLKAGDIVTFSCGTNDIQGGADPDVVAGYVQGPVTYIRSEGTIPFIGVPGLWYTSTVSGQGFATSNYGEGARTRSAILHKCAELGVPVLDEAVVLGPCLADYVADPGQTDQRWRDNIHYTTLSGRLMGVAWAKLIAGYLAPAISKNFADEELPATGYRNGWGAGSEGARISRQGDMVFLSGFISSGTATDTTAIYVLPQGLRPKHLRRRYLYGNGGTVRVEVSPDGTIAFNETPSGSVGSFVVLDGVSFAAN